jgi:hypothetical protein
VRRRADRHLAVSTWLRLLHGYALIERELRRAVAEHCTFPQFDVLSQLDRERDGLTFVELSRRLLVTAGNLRASSTGSTPRSSCGGPSTRPTAAPFASP